MKSIARTVLLGAFLGFSSLSSASNPEVENAQALGVLSDYAKWLNTGNGFVLSSLRSCITAAKAGKIDQASPVFIRLSSMLGEEISQGATCRELLARYFGIGESEPREFRKHFRLTQYYAALSQTGSTSSNNCFEREMVDGSESSPSTFDHPIRGSLDWLLGGPRHLPAPEALVRAKTLQDYRATIDQNCRDYLQTKEGTQVIQRQLKRHPRLLGSPNLCQWIKKKSNPGLTWQESWALGVVQNSYCEFAVKRRHILKTGYLESYMKEVADRPQLLLLTTSQPNLTQAEAVVIEMQKHQDSYSKRLRAMRGGDLLGLTELMNSSPTTVTSLVAKKLRSSPDHAQEILQRLFERHVKQERTQSYVTTGALLGASALCFMAPSGRFTLAIKSLCSLTIGLPVDFLFLHQALSARTRALDQLLLSPDFNFVTGKPEKVGEADAALVYTLLFLPLDVPYASVNKLLRTILP